MGDKEKHIFISYSHHNLAFVDQLSADLSAAGVRIWIDHSGLAPGTPSWEQAIRDAIRASSSMLLVASPASRISLAVQGEVSVARSQGVRVIPLWVDGDDWYECVALDMVAYHYLNFRDNRYATAVARLIALLQQDTVRIIPSSAPQVAETPLARGRMLVDLSRVDAKATLPITHAVEDSIFDTLNALYLNYLWETFPPYTYGPRWILASKSRGIQRLAAPWAFCNAWRHTRQD